MTQIGTTESLTRGVFVDFLEATLEPFPLLGRLPHDHVPAVFESNEGPLAPIYVITAIGPGMHVGNISPLDTGFRVAVLPLQGQRDPVIEPLPVLEEIGLGVCGDVILVVKD